MICTRYQELAKQAHARMTQLGHDPVAAICWAIEQAVDENIGAAVDIPSLPLRNRGMRRTALLLAHHGVATPSMVARGLGTKSKVAWVYLRRLVRDGHAMKDRKIPGAYRLTTTGNQP